MSLRITREDFFLDLLDTEQPALAEIGRICREEGADAAEGAFARCLRSMLSENIARYFAEPDTYEENAWREPGEDDLAVAERLLAHRYISIGYPHDFGQGCPIDFAHNPTPNRYAEWTWQLSRHHEWRHLARMWKRTGETRFLDELTSLFRHFIETTDCPENMRGFATECYRTIEIGIRLANNWPFVLCTMLEAERVSDSDITLFFMALYENALRLRTNPTSHNWLIMEMNGLLHTAVVFPIFRASREWRAYAFGRLLEELERQFYPDNFQFELTTGYHGCVLMNYFTVMKFCRRFDIELPERLETRIADAHSIYIDLMQPDGRTPSLNDGHRASLAEHMREAADYFGEDDPRFLWGRTDRREGAPPAYTSVTLPYSGIAVMRSGWGEEDSFAMLESAPFGYAHQHEDKLEVLLYAHGRELLTDFGNYAYDDSPMRRYILSSHSHNTAIVDGQGQSRGIGYSWQPEDIRKPAAIRVKSSPLCHAASGVYDEGYGREKIPVTHTRSLLWFKEGYGHVRIPFYLVLDDFDAKDGKPHTYTTLWHAPYDLECRETAGGACFVYGDGVTLTLLSSAPFAAVRGQTEPFPSGISLVHAAEEDKASAPFGHLPLTTLHGVSEVARIVTLLVPMRDGETVMRGVAYNGDIVTVLTDSAPLLIRLSEHLPAMPME